jgi:glutamate synthase domain-containing protein 2
VRDALVGAGLRERVRVIASGKLTTGADLVAALARGADLCASARPFLIAMGCIQALICASNECPTGIATQDRRLTRGLAAEAMAHNVARYHAQTLAAFRELVAVTGCSSAAALGAAHLAPGEPAPALRPGQLVEGGELPRPWAEAWQLARGDRF